MISVHRLQTSLLNNNRENQTSINDPFTRCRQNLEQQWKELIEYLQRCYAFAADVASLKEMQGSEDAREFLDDMVTSAEEVKNHSQRLKEYDFSGAISEVRKLEIPGT